MAESLELHLIDHIVASDFSLSVLDVVAFGKGSSGIGEGGVVLVGRIWAVGAVF